MIAVETKIHDKFSLEFKVAYKARRKMQVNNFVLNTWIFIPNSLDINSATYSRDDFYKDIRTNIRLITPVFLVREIACGEAIPLRNLEAAMQHLAINPTRGNVAEYEYQIKMFSAIYKSAIRDQLAYIYKAAQAEEKERLVTCFLKDISEILAKYRNLAKIIKAPTVEVVVYNYYLFGDEFMTNLTEKELFNLIDKFNHLNESELRAKILPLVLVILEKEQLHKVVNKYITVQPESPDCNKEIVFRLDALKRYVESDLFINAKKKRDGRVAEQVYYSIAAGLSMVFATAIAFSIQLKYGNFTMPLFVALVVSYMLKDRIKELMRYYFAQKISAKYYDNKTTINVIENEIGFSKESFDFIEEVNVPKDIIRVRNRIPLIEAENRYAKEKIILFRKTVQIDRKLLDKSTNYNIDGVVEIVRFNLLSLMRNTDNPEVPLFVLDKDEKAQKIMAVKNYYLNIIIQFKHDDDEQYIRYRVGFNRVGINSLSELSS